MEELPTEVAERVPAELFELIELPGQPRSGRTPTLQWLAFKLAEHGLTNNEIALVIAYRDSLWGPRPKYSDHLPYTKWREIIRMVDRARAQYPAQEQGRYIDGPIEDSPDTWLAVD